MTDIARRLRARFSGIAVGMVFVGSLFLVYGESLGAHARLAANRRVFNDDARQQIAPFLRYEKWTGFSNDYIGEYYLACFPLGYRSLYTLAAFLGGTTLVSKFLPYLLLLVTVVFVALTANRIGGRWAGWVAAACCLGSGEYLERMAGGLPRAFGFPIVAAGMFALATGNVGLLAVLVLVGAAFYPVGGVLLGVSLALLLLTPPESRGGATDWSIGKRVRVLAGVALAAAVIVSPSILGSGPYGPLITPDRLAAFPEAGPEGRYRPIDDRAFDAAPLPVLVRTARTVVKETIPDAGRPLWPAARRWLEGSLGWWRWALGGLILLSGVGYLRLAWIFSPARRVLALPLAAAIGYFLSALFPPLLYLPQRYVLFSLPPLLSVVLATGGAGLLRRRSESRWRFRRIVVPALGLICLCFIGGRGSRDEGLERHRERTGLYGCLAALPPDSLIAGWPSGAIDNVPYFSHHRALVTFETLQAFHVQYTLEMRRRTDAVIKALFATEPDPLARLRDEFGVTHLLVDLEVLRDREALRMHSAALFPFEPFDATIRSALDRAWGRPLEVLRQLPRAGVFRDDRYAVLDLSRLDRVDFRGRPRGVSYPATSLRPASLPRKGPGV